MAFAEVSDIATRLEEAILVGPTAATAAALITKTTALICLAAGKVDDDWFDDLTPIQQEAIKGITIDVVCREMATPQGLLRASESIGAYSRSEDYGVSPSLTADERAAIVTLVGVGRSGSVRVPSLVHDVYVTEP